MVKTYVSLDLETTGLDSTRDSIIEIGAVRFQGSRELDVFSTFVNPERHIPSFVTELTGITDAHVASAPLIHEVMGDLLNFIGRDTVIGHNVGFDLAFLRHNGGRVRNPRIDTFELAGILVPHASRYSLGNLVYELGMEFPLQTHRALDDARMAEALFVELFRRAQQLSSTLLEEIFAMGERVRWSPRYFFRDALRARKQQRYQGGLGAQLAAQLGEEGAAPLFLPEVEFDPLEPRPEPILLGVEELHELLLEEGPLAEAFEEYEFRQQQALMMEAVTEAFNQGEHLLVEAGTGTGKSLAYLIPAVRWADQNDDRVVISTNTINLQGQLLNNDIPILERLFPTGFRAMVLKGRSHYLCRRQFEALRRRGPSNEDELRVLAKVLLWLPNTVDGDGDGLFLPTYQERAVWARISAASENCDARKCPYYHGEGCFFYRARERAETAHLLVVNHALLLADIASQNRVLPDYQHLIVDEAHHLEHATTESLHFSVSWFNLRYSLDELLQGHGSEPLIEELQELALQLRRNVRPKVESALVQLTDLGERVAWRLEDLFETLGAFLDDHAKTGGRYGARLRITPDMRAQPGWDRVIEVWASASPPYAAFVEELSKLAKGLEELVAVEMPELEVPHSRLVALTRRLDEVRAQLEALISEPSDNAIYWLEEGRNGGPISFHAVPLHIGPLVEEHLFDKKRAVILTSATLKIGGGFDYLRERLNAWDARELSVGSPFDYETAALLYIVKDIPHPGRSGYQEAVSQALLDLFIATEGRGMALFTSYYQLQSTAQAISGPLSQQDITLYSQGGGSSRDQLLESFRKGERTVLLGTRSFWEGVDIPGDDLSCLAIVKLPFDVPDDPVVSARSQACDDPFNEYMVPEAVLRFMQGFGRLIRTQTDRGVVVVLDGRLAAKRYGHYFIDSLPGPTVRTGSVRDLPEIATLWLAGEPLPPEYVPFEDGPWSVPPPEEPPWDWGP
jgi:DNA polymerase-3 subunit epsilon/ATP-dependent DNA helicase DinG